MTSREAFEAWCESQGKYSSLEYNAWVAWQAATEQILSDAAMLRVCDAVGAPDTDEYVHLVRDAIRKGE